MMLTAADISRSLKESLGEGRSLAIVSLLEQSGRPPTTVPRMLVGEDNFIQGTLGEREWDEVAARQAQALIADERQEIVAVRLGDLAQVFSTELRGEPISPRAADVRLLFEISRPPLELVVCGGGHVGQAVARAGRFLDFRVTVIDDRAEFASRERFPDPEVCLVAADFCEALRSLKITRATHLVIVTRGHKHDEMCLREVIGRPCRYLGMIGSRRRTTTIREHLRREGVPAEWLRLVHAPIGLEIGAQTPEEIALAILAEIVLVRRGGSGRPKSAEGPMAHAR